MELIGTVVRLQVQRSRLKPGERGARVYDPAPLLTVEALEVGPRGVHGLLADDRVLDVHHADHPDTRNNHLVNGLSLLTVAAADALEARYGAHARQAGESLLVDAASLAGVLLVETDDGPLRLLDLQPALPCVEFSRFCLGHDDDEDVRQALVDLDDGARGSYVRADGTGVVRTGARLWRK